MLTLTTSVTGGQWFLPVLVLIILNIALYQFAKKKQMYGLMKLLRGLEFIIFLAILILVWMIYAKGRTSLTEASFITIILVEGFGNQLLDSKRESLKNKLGSKYPWLRFGFDFIVILALGITVLSWFSFNLIGWIIAVLLILIFALISFAWSKYK